MTTKRKTSLQTKYLYGFDSVIVSAHVVVVVVRECNNNRVIALLINDFIFNLTSLLLDSTDPIYMCCILKCTSAQIHGRCGESCVR